MAAIEEQVSSSAEKPSPVVLSPPTPPAEPPSIEVQTRIYINEEPSLDEKPGQMT